MGCDASEIAENAPKVDLSMLIKMHRICTGKPRISVVKGCDAPSEISENAPKVDFSMKRKFSRCAKEIKDFGDAQAKSQNIHLKWT